jgi:hypothetical protein
MLAIGLDARAHFNENFSLRHTKPNGVKTNNEFLINMCFGVEVPISASAKSGRHSTKDIHHGLVRVVYEFAGVHEDTVLGARLKFDVTLLGVGDLVHLLVTTRTLDIPNLVELFAYFRIAKVDVVGHVRVFDLRSLSTVEPKPLATRALVEHHVSVNRAIFLLFHRGFTLRTIHLKPLQLLVLIRIPATTAAMCRTKSVSECEAL